jgi:hypothetical protein
LTSVNIPSPSVSQLICQCLGTEHTKRSAGRLPEVPPSDGGTSHLLLQYMPG